MYDTKEGALLVIDIETNALVNPDKIHVICTRERDGTTREFRQPLLNPKVRQEFIDYAKSFSTIIGHNFVQYDFYQVLRRLLPDLDIPFHHILDTLVLSRLLNYSRKGGHSIASWGEEFGIEKQGKGIEQWAKLTDEMILRCHSDTEINLRIFLKYEKYVNDPIWASALETEHLIALECARMSENGFPFDLSAAKDLYKRISDLLEPIDQNLQKTFPPRPKAVREVHPRVTASGALNMNDFRWFDGDDMTIFTGGPFTVVEFVPFNPGSPVQMVERLNEAGWRPTEKTKGHIDFLRDRRKNKDEEKRKRFETYGWKVSEQNLMTLPKDAPPAAFDLAKRIVLSSRLSDLEEWCALADLEITIRKRTLSEWFLRNIPESAGLIGSEEKEQPILSGENGNKKKIGKDTERRTFENEELSNFKNFVTTNRKSVNDGTTFGMLTDLRSKILIEWLKNNGVNVRSAEENRDLLLITITTPGKFGDSSALDAMPVWDGMKQSGVELWSTSIVKGEFNSIGAWTHRLSHSKPNLANVPVAKRAKTDTEFQTLINDFNDEMRALWRARKGYRLIGTDADGIQMRIFAHIVNDERLIRALIEGKKEDGTDIHSLHRKFLGDVCKSRDAAKTFIYAWLLGSGVGKTAEILECRLQDAKEAVQSFLDNYPALTTLKKKKIPRDAKRGYFEGLDGRLVICNDEHLMLSGYLQNGEAVIMKRATIEWTRKLRDEKIPFRLCTWPHDEWQTEIPDDDDLAKYVSDCQIQAIRNQGPALNMNLPLEGTTTINHETGFIGGYTWKETH